MNVVVSTPGCASPRQRKAPKSQLSSPRAGSRKSAVTKNMVRGQEDHYAGTSSPWSFFKARSHGKQLFPFPVRGAATLWGRWECGVRENDSVFYSQGHLKSCDVDDSFSRVMKRGFKSTGMVLCVCKLWPWRWCCGGNSIDGLTGLLVSGLCWREAQKQEDIWNVSTGHLICVPLTAMNNSHLKSFL